MAAWRFLIEKGELSGGLLEVDVAGGGGVVQAALASGTLGECASRLGELGGESVWSCCCPATLMACSAANRAAGSACSTLDGLWDDLLRSAAPPLGGVLDSELLLMMGDLDLDLSRSPAAAAVSLDLADLGEGWPCDKRESVVVWDKSFSIWSCPSPLARSMENNKKEKFIRVTFPVPFNHLHP